MSQRTQSPSLKGSPRELPAAWHWVKVADIGPVTDGDWILTADYSTEGVRLLQVGDVGIGRLRIKSSRYISQQRAAELNCTFLEPDDVLISRMPDPIGRACIFADVAYPCITAVDVSIWRPRSEIADREFLTFFLNCEEWRAEVLRLATGATRPRISRSNLERLEIPLPPLAEQKRIAGILKGQLAAVERARAAAEAQLEAANALPAAYLRDVFDGDEIATWPHTALKEIADIRGGVQKTPNRRPVEFHRPYLTVRNVQRGYLDLSQLEHFELTPDELETLRLREGDLLIVEGNGSRNHIGRNAVFDGCIEDCVHQNHIIRVRLDPTKASPRFVSRFLNSSAGMAQMVEKAQTTSGLFTLSAQKVGSLTVPLPPVGVQDEVVRSISDELGVGEQLASALTDQLKTVDAMPAALLRAAFQGRL